ncbi:MAG: universal stress protein [Terriglobales bacterium]
MPPSIRSLDAGPAIRCIVFASDFSPASQAALPHAARLARVFGALVYVLYVIEIQPWEICPEVTLQSRIDATQLLDEVGRSKEWDGIRVQAALRHGSAAAQIIRFAQEHSADLIVTGAGSRDRLRHLLLGSVAEQLAQAAPCPVLTIRSDANPPATGEAGFRNIVLATGANAGAAAGISYAAKFSNRFGANLWIAHSLRPDGRGGNNSERSWLSKLVPHREGVAPIFEIGTVEQVTIMLAQRESADLVMLAPGLGWLLPKIVQHLACPVMSVRYAIPMIRPKSFGAEIASNS